MFARYPALLLLLPYLSGLILGPPAFIVWVFKAAVSTCRSAVPDPGHAMMNLVPILASAAGAIVAQTSYPLPEGSVPVQLEGVVVDGPWDYRGFTRSTMIRLRTRFRGGSEVLPVFFAGKPPEGLETGNRLRLLSRLRAGKRRIFVDSRSELIRITGMETGYLPLNAVYRLRRKLSAAMKETLSRRSASLLNAMLLGLSGEVAPSVKNLFRVTGTAHLLAISGLHVGLVCALLVFIMRRLGVEGRVRFWALLGLLLIFCLLSGSRTPVMRAYLVCVMHLYAARANRPVDPFLPLFNVCLILVVADPTAIFELSFQLSFAGYSAILLFLKIRSFLILRLGVNVKITQRGQGAPLPLRWLGGRFLVFLGVTTASWLGTLPLTLYYFQYMNPWAPLINILAFPLFVTALNAGAIHMAVAAIGLHRSLITAWPAETCLTFFLKVLKALEALPPGRVDIPPVPGAAVLLFYALLFMIFLRYCATKAA